MRVRFLIIPAGGIILLLCTSCATMCNGTRQSIKIETDPGGATVQGDFQTITTPGVLKLKRGEVYTLEISMDGYETRRIRLDRKDNGRMLYNALLLPLAIPALIIDSYTDAGFDLEPSSVLIKLDPVPPVILTSPNCNAT